VTRGLETIVTERSRTFVETWLAALASGDHSRATEVSAPDIVLHGVGAPIRGRASATFVLASFREAFADLHIDSETLTADEARVIVRFAARGTQRVELIGLPAGETRRVDGVACFTLGEHGITSVSLYVDAGQLVKQLDLHRATASGSGNAAPPWAGRFREGARGVLLAGRSVLAAVRAEAATRRRRSGSDQSDGDPTSS
jgi:steroid delta-isomerase-like uncharacterized protein